MKLRLSEQSEANAGGEAGKSPRSGGAGREAADRNGCERGDRSRSISRALLLGAAMAISCATSVDPEPRNVQSGGTGGIGGFGGTAGSAGTGGAGGALGVGGGGAFGPGGSSGVGGTSGSAGSAGTAGSGGANAFGGTGASGGAAGTGATGGAAGSGGSSGSGGSGGSGPTKPCTAMAPEAGTGVVKAQLSTLEDASPTNSEIKPILNLVNLTNAAIPMTELKVRYWYTKEPLSTDQRMDCFYAMIDCANIVTTSAAFHAVTPAVTGANFYFELTFTGGTLAASGRTGDIKLRVHTEPYQDFSEMDDHSYCQAASLTDTDHITVYRDDVLVWGVEP
jgi:hypothetical protein